VTVSRDAEMLRKDTGTRRRSRVTASPHLRVFAFAVRDTGIGIPPNARSPVPGLQPGGHLDHAQVRRHRLGLAVSRRLTEMMGGTMWSRAKCARERLHLPLHDQCASRPS